MMQFFRIGLVFSFMVALWSSVVAQEISPLKRILVTTAKGELAWVVDLASDPDSRAKGLMFVENMPKQTGMLFRFESNRPVSMWMKNTFIALDMVFMASDGQIKSIHRGAVPHSLDIISSRGPAKFVLEMNAGEADEAGLQTGQHMRHPWFSAQQ